jgi:DNA-binding transcriptional ArsR family regulator
LTGKPAFTEFLLLKHLHIFVFKFLDMDFNELTPDDLQRAANMLKAIAHPIRISIVGCLEDGKKRTVTEIQNILGIEQSTASHHLVILRDRGVLESRREGKNTFYSLKHPNLKAILNNVSSCCQQ